MTENNKDTELEQKLTNSVSANFDAQQINEEIESGDKEAPNVDVEGDYKRAKNYETGSGSSSSDPNSTPSGAKAEGDPEAFRSAAKSINPPQ
jgi:hypothetical protein